MKINRIFLEASVADHPRARHILSSFPGVPVQEIRKIEDVWGRVRKPYLQKRQSLNLFVGRKEGQLVKNAPDAYGVNGEPHFYFIHAYNCIYECEYCYLQGYFKSPDLVFFINHEDVIRRMEALMEVHGSSPGVWFHAGEFSDSLALSHVTNEFDVYWEFLGRQPRARLELRTKSVNIRPLLALKPIENVLVTFSLSPADAARRYDHKAPTIDARIKAMSRLAAHGFPLGIHLDPVIFGETMESDYRGLMSQLLAGVAVDSIRYVSVGVVRFTKEVYREFQQNYPGSGLLAAEFVKSFDNKIRYSRPQRGVILHTLMGVLREMGIPRERVYFCMEEQRG